VAAKVRVALAALLAVGLLALLVTRPVYGATFTVTKTADTADGSCDSDCSFREAIIAANAALGIDTIAFNIPGAGPHTIQPASVLPALTDQVNIDGYTQPGSSPNTNPITWGLNTVLKITLDGLGAGSNADGIWITSGASGSTVQGLLIQKFSRAGMRLSGTDVLIRGNFIMEDGIGIAIDGLFRLPSRNKIGGTTLADVNRISDQNREGVWVQNGGANRVEGNISGGNGTHGIRVDDSDDNVIASNFVGANDHGGITDIQTL
jgi:CSLREA domain-containing protein